MYLQLKRAFQREDLSQLAVYAVTGSVVSTYLTDIHYLVQFAGSIIFVLTEFFVLNSFELLENLDRILSILLLLFLSYSFFPSFLASIFIVWLILIPHLLFGGKKGLISLALLGQLSDLVSSAVVLGGGTELNPFASYLISLFGVLPGLIVLKTLMIGLPIVWSVNYLKENELRVFLKLVFLLGISMGVRNFIFF